MTHDEHHGQHKTHPSEPSGHLGLVASATQVHEVHHHDHREHHDGDELLGDAAAQVAEAVEDALPVLKMEEHRDAAHDQQHGRGDERRHLGAGALPAQRVEALRTEHARRPREQRREQNKRPL